MNGPLKERGGGLKEEEEAKRSTFIVQKLRQVQRESKTHTEKKSCLHDLSVWQTNAKAEQHFAILWRHEMCIQRTGNVFESKWS